jgi:hypothetical protein
VRWKRRRLRRSPDEAWDAVLVRSVWSRGAARQQVVGYLASIRTRYHTAPAHRAWFWVRVEQRLAVLALDAATCQAIAARLAEVISRPTAAELDAVAAQRAALTSLPLLPPRAHRAATWRGYRHEAASPTPKRRTIHGRTDPADSTHQD